MRKSMLLPALAVELLWSALPAMGETKETMAEHPHEVRIGVGESAVDRTFFGPHDLYEKSNLYTAPNIFVEYQYRINHWCGVGVQANGSWRGADVRERIPGNADIPWQHTVHGSVAVMPTVRFTYLHREWVNLYSSVSLGYYLGVEQIDGVRAVSHGAAGDVCFLGVAIGKSHFFGSGEIGMLCGGTRDVQQFFSRLLSVSFGYRF